VEDPPLEADSSAAVSDLSVEGHQEEAEEAPPGGNPGGNQAAVQNQGHGGGGGKLQGKEPRIFDGDKNQSKEFQLEWDIYVALNHNVDVIQIAFTRAVMFLSYIKGANVHKWVQSRVRWLAEQLTGGALQNDEYLY
jgi:hypothetical protein